MKHHIDYTGLSPQAKKVLGHLLLSGSISNVEAHSVHRVRSVSRRITEIIDHMVMNCRGYRIEKLNCKDVTGQRYVRYVLVTV